MTRKQLLLCDLLQRREIGFLHRDERQQFINASIRLADELLVHNNVIKTIPYIDDSSRSSYMAVTNNHGIAAMTHSNRCISLVDTGTMKRISEINGLKRTVWTLCFHPYNFNLLATGNLGGTVCVFDKTKLIRSQNNDSNPITSISFHSKEPLIFYAIDNRIIIWNYDEDIKLKELCALEESRIKYVKYNPSTDMLITGTRRENLILYININDEPDENDETRLISCSSFLDHLMRSLSSIIDNMETSSFVDLKVYWSHFLVQTNSFYSMLESCAKHQLQPNKYIGDFNISLALMQKRLHRIACHVFNCDTNSDNELILMCTATAATTTATNTTEDTIYSIGNTFKAIKSILKLYKKEIEQFNAIDNFQFSILADIIMTIQRILKLEEFSNLMRLHEKQGNEFQYRLQAWNINKLDEIHLPDFSQDWRNLITYCYIHNDSTVEISRCGKLIASFELVNIRKVIAIHSLELSTFGEHIYSYNADMAEIIMSLSFSPSLEYLLVGVRSSEIFGYFLKIHNNSNQRMPHIDRQISNSHVTIPSNENDQIVLLKRSPNNNDVISYLKWSARSGDGIIIGHKTYQLRCLIRK